MYTIKDISTMGRPWILSAWNESPIISIPEDIVGTMANHHIVGIQFLYGNYTKKLKGAILNEEIDMDCPLQIVGFLRAITSNFVLVICPDSNLCLWHYHLTHFGKMDTLIITENNCEELSQQLKSNETQAFIVTFSKLKLLENLIDYEFSTIIIEDFDQIANKLIFRKLTGTFHIGLTTRNFYKEPNQKLQWHMLNWSNPGCVGKLSDFYSTDSENLKNFRDNYRTWWCRLTWNFCESFRKPTQEQLDKMIKTLTEWSKQYKIDFSNKTVRKRKNLEIVYKETKKTKTTTITTKEASNDADSDSSNDTIIMDDIPIPTEKYVKLPSMDETPILSSIIRNFNISPDPLQQVLCSPQPGPSRENDDAEEFLLNLVQNRFVPPKQEVVQVQSCTIRNIDDEIQEVLMEADALLQKPF